MTSDDYHRMVERRARRYRRRQRQLDFTGAVLHGAAHAAREAKRRWWPSMLVAVILGRDYEPGESR